jgi:hypothetical protein
LPTKPILSLSAITKETSSNKSTPVKCIERLFTEIIIQVVQGCKDNKLHLIKKHDKQNSSVRKQSENII